MMFLINLYLILFLSLLLILLFCVNVLGMKIHKVKKDKQKQKTINCFVSSAPSVPVDPQLLRNSLLYLI